MKTKTIFLIDTPHGISYHRFMVPMLRLSKQGYDVSVEKTIGDILKYPPEIVKQVWTSRVLTLGDSYKSFKKWCEVNSIRIIIDVDDYWYLPENAVNKISFAKGVTTWMKQTIAIADVITTPSEYLQKVIQKELNSTADFVILENALELNEPHWVNTQDKYTLERGGKNVTKFGYMGASGHELDVAEIGKTSDKLFVATTEFSNYYEMLNADFAFQTLDHASYHSLYKMVDVSLAPLQHTKFNKCKSSLKIAEAVASKTAVIASDILTYSHLIENGVDGFLCKSKKDWRFAMNKLNDLDLAKDMAQKLHDKLKDRFDIDTVNKIRVEKLGIEMRK